MDRIRSARVSSGGQLAVGVVLYLKHSQKAKVVVEAGFRF